MLTSDIINSRFSILNIEKLIYLLWVGIKLVMDLHSNADLLTNALSLSFGGAALTPPGAVISSTSNRSCSVLSSSSRDTPTFVSTPTLFCDVLLMGLWT